MDEKQCGFDCPDEHKHSTGIEPRMFNQDVGFRFLVNVKVTDPKDVGEMLKLFNQAAADFNETWKELSKA